MFAALNSFLTRAVSAGYFLSKSLRFRSSASAYLNRTLTTPTSSTIYTWSGWVKRGALSATGYLFGASTTTNFGFNSSDQLLLTLSGTAAVTTTAVYRDPAAWYHLVYVQNGSAQTIYVNGVSAGTGTTANTVFNTAIAHQLAAANTTSYFDGELTEVNFVDGQALAPTAFGASSIYNQWLPIRYAGTYGTNGFYLPFTNTASTSTLVADSSGNGNNWTPNNISLTAGSTYDSLTDVPTLTSTTVANYATWNPLKLQGNAATDGNLKATMTAGGPPYVAGYGVRSTVGIPLSGKWYAEIIPVTADAADGIGITDINTWNTDVNTIGNNTVYYRQTGTKYVNGVNNVAYGLSYSASDVIGVAVDITGGTVTFYKNNASQGAITLPSSTATYCFLVTNGNATAASFTANFGQQPFAYTPPSGFLPLNTFNI